MVRHVLVFTVLMMSLGGCASTSSLEKMRTVTGPGAHAAIHGQQALQQALHTIFESDTLKRLLAGAKVVRLRDGATLFEHNAERYFHPASTMKLFSTEENQMNT